MESLLKDTKSTLKLATPIIFGQIAYILMGFVDTVMVARLGVAELGSVAFSSNIVSVGIICSLGMSSAIAALVSEAEGAGKKHLVGRYLRHGVLLLQTYGLLLLGLFSFLILNIHWFNQTPEITKLAPLYLKWVIYSFPAIALFHCFKQFYEATHRSVVPMVAVYSANILNVVLNYALIFGNFGAPEMGIEGAAIASLASRYFMATSIIIYTYTRKNFAEYGLSFANFKLELPYLKKTFQIGIPSSLQYLFEVGAFAFCGVLAGTLGNTEISSHQIALNLAAFTYMGALGWSFASSVKIGNAFGSEKYTRIKSYGWNSIVAITIYMSITALFFVLFRNQLPKLYIDDMAVLKLSAGVLIFAAIFQLADGIQATCLGLLRGIQDVKVPTIITLIVYWVLTIPGAYYAAHKTQWGLYGIWFCLTAGLFLSAFALMLRFKFKSDQLLKK
ncbi:MAG: MATE family efflux transporter [Bdellovibrionales bacterium]